MSDWINNGMREYIEEKIEPRLLDLKKQERMRFVQPMTHESEVEEWTPKK